MSHLSRKSSAFSCAVDFTQLILKQNSWCEAAFSKWIFSPGMLFQSIDKWWGDFGKRPTPHEGLDLCLYEDTGGRLHHLNASTQIPVIADCRVVKIMDDFLGKTVMLEHDLPEKDGGLFLTIFGHAKPDKNLCVDDRFKKGDVICTVSEPEKLKILPHLHITMAKVLQQNTYAGLNWDTIPKSDLLTLTDPLPFLNGAYDIQNNIKKSAIGG